jgi:hypothetical protein
MSTRPDEPAVAWLDETYSQPATPLLALPPELLDNVYRSLSEERTSEGQTALCRLVRTCRYISQGITTRRWLYQHPVLMVKSQLDSLTERHKTLLANGSEGVCGSVKSLDVAFKVRWRVGAWDRSIVLPSLRELCWLPGGPEWRSVGYDLSTVPTLAAASDHQAFTHMGICLGNRSRALRDPPLSLFVGGVEWPWRSELSWAVDSETGDIATSCVIHLDLKVNSKTVTDNNNIDDDSRQLGDTICYDQVVPYDTSHQKLMTWEVLLAHLQRWRLKSGTTADRVSFRLHGATDELCDKLYADMMMTWSNTSSLKRHHIMAIPRRAE